MIYTVLEQYNFVHNNKSIILRLVYVHYCTVVSNSCVMQWTYLKDKGLLCCPDEGDAEEPEGVGQQGQDHHVHLPATIRKYTSY